MSKRLICSATLLLTAAIMLPDHSHASLLVHYTGDETGGSGSPFLDASVNGNDGAQDGTNQETSIVKIGPNAMKINGSSTSIDVAANNPDFNRTYSAFSLSMWVNPLSGENNANRYFAGKMAGGGNRGWQLTRGTDTTMGFLYFDGPSGTSQSINTGTTVAAETYTHLAVTYAADDFLRMYLDGVLVSEMTEANDDILSSFNGVNNALFQVGNRGDNISGSGNGSTGARIDDFGLWDEALTTAQIQRIFAGGNAGLNLQQALVPETSTFALGFAAICILGVGIARRRWSRAV